MKEWINNWISLIRFKAKYKNDKLMKSRMYFILALKSLSSIADWFYYMYVYMYILFF